MNGASVQYSLCDWAHVAPSPGAARTVIKWGEVSRRSRRTRGRLARARPRQDARAGLGQGRARAGQGLAGVVLAGGYGACLPDVAHPRPSGPSHPPHYCRPPKDFAISPARKNLITDSVTLAGCAARLSLLKRLQSFSGRVVDSSRRADATRTHSHTHTLHVWPRVAATEPHVARADA